MPGLAVRGAGHWVVHGGRDFAAPAWIDDEVLARLDRLVPLAPAHQPLALAGIRAVAEAWLGLLQVASFDTAFHRTQPCLAQLFPIPRALGDEGLLRYGFHGLSYEHVAAVLPEVAGPRAEGRVIVAYLGHDALVFTAGIGERSPRMRAASAAGLAAFGVALDPARNATAKTRIGRVGSRVAVYVVPANEGAGGRAGGGEAPDRVRHAGPMPGPAGRGDEGRAGRRSAAALRWINSAFPS